ncbi:MAG: hypothetical protein WC026_01770 [Hyphomicrobium sp.]|uniref:hypothetical protein n=1 Tax=Hyphomicrobium sp. TaxID=82 RepID=UPI00356AA55E
MEHAAGVYKHVIFPDGIGDESSPLTEIQKAMLDVTPDCIKLLSPDGRLLNMNRAGCIALGISEGTCFGMPWLPPVTGSRAR